MHRPLCIGISASEVHAALVMSDIPRKQWREVRDGVVLMGKTAAEAINSKRN